MGANNYVQMMIDSLQMKIRILQQLVKLNEEQAAIASTPQFDEDAFKENAEKKEELINNLDNLDGGFQSVFDRIKIDLTENRQEYLSEIETMQKQIREVTDLSVQIQAQEARNKTSLQNRFNMMKKDIQNAKRSTKLANQYYKNVNRIDAEPQFMDQKN